MSGIINDDMKYIRLLRMSQAVLGAILQYKLLLDDHARVFRLDTGVWRGAPESSSLTKHSMDRTKSMHPSAPPHKHTKVSFGRPNPAIMPNGYVGDPPV